MNRQDQEILTRESSIFTGAAIGKTAKSKYRKNYIVNGSYLDSNGCMKTYGKESNNNDCESFILDTNYI